MTLLPAIRWGGNVWLLPLAPRSAEGLAAVLMELLAGDPRRVGDFQEGGPQTDWELLSARVGGLLRADPALAIFAAVEFLRADSAAAGAPIEIDELASWLVGAAPQLWLDGDAALAAGEVPDSLALARWGELYRTAMAQPLERWIEGAADWLRVAGPDVPHQWREAWPQLIDSSGDFCEGQSDHENDGENDGHGFAVDPGYGKGHLNLTRLARTLRDHRVLRDRFSARLQVEKLQSLRQLAYGLSHEINNPLANISTRAQQLAAGEEDPERHQRLERITESALRAHEMIADLMYFAHPPRPRRQPIDVSVLAAGVVDEFRARCASHQIAVRLRCGGRTPPRRGSHPPEDWTVTADREQLADALRALVRNSIEAVGTRGAIEVRVRRAAPRLVIEVIDSGPGLSEEARQHAFDPYYSGREAGRGLGLGLCRVYRVARAHGGGAAILSLAVGCRTRMWIAAS